MSCIVHFYNNFCSHYWELVVISLRIKNAQNQLICAHYRLLFAHVRFSHLLRWSGLTAFAGMWRQVSYHTATAATAIGLPLYARDPTDSFTYLLHVRWTLKASGSQLLSKRSWLPGQRGWQQQRHDIIIWHQSARAPVSVVFGRQHVSVFFFGRLRNRGSGSRVRRIKWPPPPKIWSWGQKLHMELMKINVSCYLIKLDFWPWPPVEKWFPSVC